MADQIVLPLRVTDTNGTPASGALIYTYEEGTDTLLTTYTDAALSDAHANPLVCDSGGHPPQAFYSGTPGVRLRITDALGNLIDDMDPAITAGDDSGANQVAFDPITGNTATNSQTAIANNTGKILTLEENERNATRPVLTAGSGTIFTITAPDTITAYAQGQTFLIVSDRENSGASTLGVDGLGPLDLYKYDNTGTAVPLVASDMVAGGTYRVTHDGARFVIVSSTNATEDKAGIVEKATTAEETAGTANNKYPSVGGVKRMIDTFVPNQVIAHGSLNGTGTPAWTYQTGFGASVTDNGTGDYTVAFDAAEADTEYTVQVNVESDGTRYFTNPHTKTVNGFDVSVIDVNGTRTDLAGINITVTR